MLDRESNITDITDAAHTLVPYLTDNKAGYQGLRRRAVLHKYNDQWALVACTVEGVPADVGKIDVVTSRSYSKVLLHEDWLSSEALLDFVKQVNDGLISLGNHSIEAKETHIRWSRDRVPLENNYMSRAGQVFATRFARDNAGSYGALFAPNQPYYPDITEAARDWLPFPIYHGSSDARNGEVILLLPETRAFFCEVETEGDILNLKISGTCHKDPSLSIKGAWWDATGLNHFDVPVVEAHGHVQVPIAATRVECVLADPAGTIYDYLSEYNYRYRGLGSNLSIRENTSLGEVVWEACQRGEGRHIEFKPFVDLDGKKNSEKLKEIFKTVVAFANTKGGRIFLGINDDCELEGIEEQLARWVKSAPDANACEKYMGALRGRIRDVLVGETTIAFKQAVVNDRLIAIVEVSEATEKPLYIRQDHHFYVRRGSNNTKAAPDEWKLILAAQGVQHHV